MKKIISMVMALCLCFSICACGEAQIEPNDKPKNESSSSKVDETDRDSVTAFAPSRKYSQNPVTEKRTLNNTAYKLKNDKKLNVLYYGGSVTWGSSSTEGNSWASRITKWLKETYSDANINSTNAALGGTSVYFGCFRAETDLLPYKPDLLFIEFAVNDKYEGMLYSESAYYLEMLIKKVSAKYPQTDIVVLLITDKGKLGGKFENSDAHKAVADHYGIPCIDVGAALAKKIEKENGKWEDYIADYVHPNDAGHGEYASCIIDTIKPMLDVTAKTLKNHVMPTEDFVVGGINMNCKVLTAEDVKRNGGWKKGKEQVRKYTSYLYPSKRGDKLKIEFEGASFGVYLTTAKGNTVVATIDGKERDYIVMPDTEGEHEKLVFDNLTKGKHTVEIEYVSSNEFKIFAFFIG